MRRKTPGFRTARASCGCKFMKSPALRSDMSRGPCSSYLCSHSWGISTGAASVVGPSFAWTRRMRWAQYRPIASRCSKRAPTTFSQFKCLCADSSNVRSIISSLKLIGYSWDLPQSSGLIERMEAYVALSHIFPPLDNTWTGPGMFDMSPTDDFATYYNNNQVTLV